MRTELALAVFLTEFLGTWPAAGTPTGAGPAHGELTVVGDAARMRPGWDGVIRDAIGVAAPDRSVISVPPMYADAVRAAVRTWDDAPARLPAAIGRPDATAYVGTFRWTTDPTGLPDAGTWIDVTDPRVPAWLRPFGGQALVALINGEYAAGVGIKRHNAAGVELSVGTDEAHRGKGLASRLVAQAARWALANGTVPIYLHDPANIASARTADAAGFPDAGWQILGMPPAGYAP